MNVYLKKYLVLRLTHGGTTWDTGMRVGIMNSVSTGDGMVLGKVITAGGAVETRSHNRPLGCCDS